MARETTPAPAAAEAVRGPGAKAVTDANRERVKAAERAGQADVTGPGGKVDTGGAEEASDGAPGNSAVDVGPGPGGTDDDGQRARVHPSGEFPETVPAEED